MNMRKRVGVAVPVGDGSRDRGEKNYDLYFDDKEIVMQSGFKTVDRWPLSEVTSVDCYRAESPRDNGAATAAAVGYVVGGVTGAIVGGLVGGASKGSWFIEIKTAEKVMTFRIILEAHKTAFDKWAKQRGMEFGN
jgi:hypothetical protein